MIFSFAGVVPAYRGMKDAYELLQTKGVTGIQGTGIGPKVLFDVCGLQDAVEVDVAAGGEDYKGLWGKWIETLFWLVGNRAEFYISHRDLPWSVKMGND